MDGQCFANFLLLFIRGGFRARTPSSAVDQTLRRVDGKSTGNFFPISISDIKVEGFQIGSHTDALDRQGTAYDRFARCKMLDA